MADARIDSPSYLFPTAMAIKNYRYPRLEVRVDEQLVFGPAPGLAFAPVVGVVVTTRPETPPPSSEMPSTLIGKLCVSSWAASTGILVTPFV